MAIKIRTFTRSIARPRLCLGAACWSLSLALSAACSGGSASGSTHQERPNDEHFSERADSATPVPVPTDFHYLVQIAYDGGEFELVKARKVDGPYRPPRGDSWTLRPWRYQFRDASGDIRSQGGMPDPRTVTVPPQRDENPDAHEEEHAVVREGRVTFLVKVPALESGSLAFFARHAGADASRDIQRDNYQSLGTLDLSAAQLSNAAGEQ